MALPAASPAGSDLHDLGVLALQEQAYYKGLVLFLEAFRTAPVAPPAPPLSFDQAAEAVPLEALRARFDFPIERVQFDPADYEAWADAFVPEAQRRYGDRYYKKPLELFITWMLLNPRPTDAFMDAAGGINTYLHQIDVAERYMQNITISADLRRRFGPGIRYVEGDACAIPLPDASLDKISMHHSFEHFQGDSDTAFIREAQRLLRVGGKCCILPLFLGTRYVEVTRLPRAACPFDAEALYVVDEAARLTGGPSCGDFARVYDSEAFRRRVLGAVDRSRFRVTLQEIYLGDGIVPDPDRACHRGISRINFPYRAFTIERIS